MGVDFGYKLGNELIKNAIRDDVTRQVSSGLDWSFDLAGREPLAGASVAGEQVPPRQQVAGVKLPVGRDGVPILELPSPLVDVAEQVVPPLGVDSQG